MYSLKISNLFAILFLHMLHLDFQTINAFITFCYFLMQFRIAMLQLFQFSTSEKRTDSACYGGGRIGGYAFEFVRAYLGFYLFEFLFSKSYLLLLVPLGFLYTLQFGFLFLYDEIVTFQMFLACFGFRLSSFHQENVRSQTLHFGHILVI